ncbi:threonine kinase receptor-associated protein [Seminavis robusta]|uniref:Serine-threonine kinase receptor-associated protein n=1 Tax=Seminavis robusta TaxID=568900 RepID=A0A9N8HVW4_9STRA|nr:threonine kinase receptor-associated protein [Seminavis robusta]|eukprot:Sro1558_g282360.1 threonine kinase receptor-associated protein (329) ;mRNA; f:10224-11303
MADKGPNTKGRQIPIVCPGHTRPLAELQFCHVKEENRTLLVSACHDKMPMMRDGTSGDWIGTFAGHKGAVWSCQLDSSGSLCATASGDFSVQVWDAITGQSLWQFPHKHIVKTVDFTPNLKRLASGGHEGIVRIFDLQQAAQQKKLDPVAEIPQSPATKILIAKCKWWTDSILLTGSSDGKIRFWDIPEQQQTLPTEPTDILETDGAEVRDMELTKLPNNGGDILTVAAGDKVYFFQLQEKKLLHVYKMPIHFREEGGATLHPDGTRFVAGGSDLWVRVFDFATGNELECNKGHHGPIRCVRYSPDGKLYASGSEDGTIRLWKTDPEE